MASTRSYYKTLLRSDWRRLWPISVGYTVIWFFMMPAMILAGNHYLIPSPDSALQGVTAEMLAERVVMEYAEALPFFSIVFGLLYGVALFNYLMNSRSVGLMHSLPANRTTQFLGHCLSGVVMFTGSNLIIVITTFLALALQGAVNLSGLITWFVIAELETFFFFMFAVLCCMATGWLLAVPVIYAGLNCVYVGYEALLRLQVSFFYWGCEDGLSNISPAATYLTPIYAMSDKVIDYTYDHNIEYGRYTILDGGIRLLLIYTLVALGMGAFAWFLYRIRHSESAHDPIVFPWLRPIVSAVISTACGLALGFVLAAIFDSLYNFGVVAVCQILCGVVTAIIMEMILQKTYKVFNTTAYKRAGAVITFIVILIVGARLDPFGVQKYVPDADDVESVTLYSSYVDRSTLVEPEAIDAVRNVHTALLPRVDIQYSDTSPSVHYCNIRYHMNNGTTVYRRYEYYENNTAVNDAMDELLKIEEVRKGMLLRSYSWKNDADNADIGTDFTGGWFHTWGEDKNNEGELTKSECREIYNALMRDTKENLHSSLSLEGYSAINIGLETKLGSYELVRLYPECTNTIDLLLAMGVVESAYDLFDGAVDLPAIYPLPAATEQDAGEDVVFTEDVNMDPNSFPDTLTSFPDTLDSSSLGIIGGSDGPTQVIVTEIAG